MAGTTRYYDAGVSPAVDVYVERQMLKYAQPVLVLEKTGPLIKPMPKNAGMSIDFRRPKIFSPATTPLMEGVTPSMTSFRYDHVRGTLKQYGDVVGVTDWIEDLHTDPVLNDAAEQCGENIGRTREALNWGVLRAGLNVYYANGNSRANVNSPITLAKQRAVIRGLKTNKAMKITKVLDGSVNYRTSPIEAAYIGVCHTDLESDIRNLAGFTPCAEYGSRRPICEHEIGSVEDVRYMCSPDLDPFTDAGGGAGTMVSTSGTAADVYPILYFGKEAWGMVPLRGMGAVSPTILRPGVKDKSDPLGQRGFVGWKMWHLALILNHSWMCRLEVSATAL